MDMALTKWAQEHEHDNAQREHGAVRLADNALSLASLAHSPHSARASPLPPPAAAHFCSHCGVNSLLSCDGCWLNMQAPCPSVVCLGLFVLMPSLTARRTPASVNV